MNLSAEVRRFPLGSVLRLSDGEGHTGYGEASPLAARSAETLDRATRRLEEIAAALTVGLSPGRVRGDPRERMEALLDPESWAARAADSAGTSKANPTGDCPPSVAFAVESAVLDLVGHRRSIPAHRLLAAMGGAPAPIPLNGVLTLENARDSSKLARLLHRGIRTVKVKIGRAPFEQEWPALRDLRAALGPAIALRLDVNGAWSLEEARRNLETLAEIDPEYVEQPVSADSLPDFDSSPVALAADESVADGATLDRLLERDTVRVLVLKPGALGGFRSCLRIAALAGRAGLDVVVTHFLDGPIARAAAAELALALPQPPRACGLDRHPGLDEWPGFSAGRIGTNAIASNPDAGLALHVPDQEGA